ncbi:alpha/beta fold hydrolase [Croceiramulus getboli]|nr:alpha/beta fold hydrolase [Flavobacteriaceae bacterium YJPT1-3]
MLHTASIPQFRTLSGTTRDFELTYRLFGPPLGSAPVVLVNHALTGNSQVSGDRGWWNALIGPDRVIDTKYFTVLAMDIPGNGHDGKSEHLIHNYKSFAVRDIALLQCKLLEQLEIKRLYAAIGGSLGGNLVWELAAIRPELIEHIIPVATDWKATDWLLANCLIQDQLLNNSSRPIADARMHAMTFYRTAASFKKKFHRTINRELGIFNIESWLLHHGRRLEERFQLASYKLMNHLLTTTDITQDGRSFEEVVAPITGTLHLVSVDTDQFFLANEIQHTYETLKELAKPVTYHEIQSIHGHDAFLIEFDQLNEALTPVFNPVLCP